MVPESDNGCTYLENFVARYKVKCGFALKNRAMIVNNYLVRAVVPVPAPVINRLPHRANVSPPPMLRRSQAYFENRWEEINLYDMRSLESGHVVQGPSIIVQTISTVVLEINCVDTATHKGNLVVNVGNGKTKTKPVQEANKNNKAVAKNPVRLSVYGHRFMGIAEQMGLSTAHHRLSYLAPGFSCASSASSTPVYLCFAHHGSAQTSLRSVMGRQMKNCDHSWR